MIKTYAQN